jgi:hypothetical protein
MLKIFLISLVLFGLCFIDTKNGFAITAEDSLNKNNTQNTKQTEPYFDLPKKDAKEQCDEVERVYDECYQSDEVFPKINDKYRCGNILFESLDYYPLDENVGGVMIFIYDKRLQLIGASGRLGWSQYGATKKIRKTQEDMRFFEIEKRDIKKSLQAKDYRILSIKNCFPVIINFN